MDEQTTVGARPGDAERPEESGAASPGRTRHGRDPQRPHFNRATKSIIRRFGRAL